MAALLSFSVYVLLDTFVIPHSISQVQTEKDSGDGVSDSTDYSGKADESQYSDIFEEDSQPGSNSQSGSNSQPGSGSQPNSYSQSGDNTQSGDSSQSGGTYTSTSYQDENISINIATQRVDDTTIYIADVVLLDAALFKTALAQDTFGTNITETTSVQAKSKNAILAINGDFYGADKKGYVIKNGVIYRDSVRADSEYDDLVVYENGEFGIINEKDISAQQLAENSVVQLFAFGPVLVENGEVVVDEDTEVGKAMASNPRTAIGIVDKLHYVFVVADGRSSESEGLSIYELAQLMKSYGCETAYNLDGGGSSTMYFNGQVINRPTTNGHSFKEREVSDIVYIGY